MSRYEPTSAATRLIVSFIAVGLLAFAAWSICTGACQ